MAWSSTFSYGCSVGKVDTDDIDESINFADEFVRAELPTCENFPMNNSININS